MYKDDALAGGGTMPSLHRFLLGPTILALTIPMLASGCGPRAVLFVDVTGSSAGLAIDALQVRLTNQRHGRSIDLTYPPAEGTTSVDLPNSFVVRIFGDVETDDEIFVTIAAMQKGIVRLEGSGTG